MTATRYDLEDIHQATADLNDSGGWLIDQGDCLWHTTEEGTAIDLTLPLTHEDRARATAVVVGAWDGVISRHACTTYAEIIASELPRAERRIEFVARLAHLSSVAHAALVRGRPVSSDTWLEIQALGDVVGRI